MKEISCQASGEPVPSISWYFNGILLNNETDVDKYDISEISSPSETTVNTTTISSTLTPCPNNNVAE